MSADTAVPLAFATESHVCAAMRAEIVTDFDELTSLDHEWTQLWNESPSATIFQSLPWQRAWWKAFGSGLQLCTPVIRKDNEVVGILPLIRDHTTVRFLGTPGTDYCDILCREELAPIVLRMALKCEWPPKQFFFPAIGGYQLEAPPCEWHYSMQRTTTAPVHELPFLGTSAIRRY